jgi:hypothetical protein
VEARTEPNFSYRLLRAIYPAFRVLFPNQVIRADDLARAMVEVVVRGTGQGGGRVFENRDIRAMVESLHPQAVIRRQGRTNSKLRLRLTEAIIGPGRASRTSA